MPEELDNGRRHPIKQLEVLAYSAWGLTQHEIAAKLKINRSSVQSRLENAYRHLGVTPGEALQLWERVREELAAKSEKVG